MGWNRHKHTAKEVKPNGCEQKYGLNERKDSAHTSSTSARKQLEKIKIKNPHMNRVIPGKTEEKKREEKKYPEL